MRFRFSSVHLLVFASLTLLLGNSEKVQAGYISADFPQSTSPNSQSIHSLDNLNAQILTQSFNSQGDTVEVEHKIFAEKTFQANTSKIPSKEVSRSGGHAGNRAKISASAELVNLPPRPPEMKATPYRPEQGEQNLKGQVAQRHPPFTLPPYQHGASSRPVGDSHGLPQINKLPQQIKLDAEITVPPRTFCCFMQIYEDGFKPPQLGFRWFRPPRLSFSELLLNQGT